jgi:hypothetical protein
LADDSTEGGNRLQIVGILFVGMNDPRLAVVTIVGLVGVVGMVVGAVMRLRGGRGWDGVFLGGAVLIAATFVVTLAYSWLTSRR